MVNSATKVPVFDWNVIDEVDFKNRVRTVFGMVSSALVKTLGPYGQTTIIEKFGEMHITKDGWQVLKKIHYGDNINNTIMQLLINISAQVVIKVGDGSTSSIVAANEILKELEGSEELKNIRSKELMLLLSRCVEMIATKILEFSTKIDKSGTATYDEIYKLAMISTNGDEQIANIMREIYLVTGNPSIEFVQSKTHKTTYEIIDGYKTGITYLDPIFANNENGTCDIDNPLVLMFDHKIEKFHFDNIISKAAQKAMQTERRLIVIAPYYDKYLLNVIQQQITIEYKATGKSTIVYSRVSLFNNIANEHYNDFCMMTGGMMITEASAQDIAEDKVGIENFIGEVGKISIGDKTTMIKGFHKRSEDLYKTYLNDAISKYNKVEESHRERGIVNSELYDLKQRISKLKGKMGIINVGGYSSLEKQSNFDLVEDAVKACESAFNYGYNIGGNLIIPIAIDDLMYGETELTEMEMNILDLLSKAFKSVFKKVLINKYGESKVKVGFWAKLFGYKPTENTMLEDIVEKCVEKQECYDLINEQYSDDIINSCFTDIEILKAATSIVSLLISSNQFISIMVNKEE